LGVLQDDLDDVREERKQIVVRYRGLSWMRAVVPELEAASEPRVLVGVDDLHTLEDPQDVRIQHELKLADRRHALCLVELLEPALRLAGHGCGGDVELLKPDLLDGPMYPGNGGAPSHHRRGADEAGPRTVNGFLQVGVVDVCLAETREQFV